MEDTVEDLRNDMSNALELKKSMRGDKHIEEKT
jgi:hypothetical protein